MTDQHPVIEKLSKFDKLLNWIRSQITLRRVWYVFFIGLSLFIVFSIFYPELYYVQLGAIVFSMILVYLAMITSNKELRESTEKQITTFVNNLQSVTKELQGVSQEIRGLAGIMQEVQRTILESTLVSKAAIAKAGEEKKKRKEIIKPQLLVRMELKGFQFWVFDNRHYHLLIWNAGSDAIGTIIGIRNLEYGPYDIGTRQQVPTDIGHINDFKGISILDVSIMVRDVDKNLYRATVGVSLPQPQWASISLVEA